ncbi:acid phosphatase, putative [Leishmania tarentolae]|uniref:Acid phosphatase, putative n=1 Tax=Leishmania tarentolae TaxID=5689 RepID=A0A640KWF0_LEITA|nr:acid phosphatase, putative [Leishmania tarentolae]
MASMGIRARSSLTRLSVFVTLVALSLVINVSRLVSAFGLNSAQRNKPLTESETSYPVHPRVNINWTQQSVNSNIAKEERKEILKSKLVLTKLVVLNRHGHRAPNAPFWKMCPNDKKSRKHYKVAAEDLTGLGMEEEYNFGQYLRNTYHTFLGDKFNRTLHYFRAVGEPRILQSAMAVAQGIFPDGFGPGGYLPSRPQFVPIFSDMDTHEYLLDDVPCFRRAENDSHRWINNRYQDFINDPSTGRVLEMIKEVCGEYTGKAESYAYIKTVADGLTFNSDMGLKVAKGKLTPEVLFSIRNVSLQLLMQRLYYTDEQQTYMAVDLPRNILRLLTHTHVGETPEQLNDFTDTRQESTFYFMHREALYAFAQFFGFQYNVAGLPPGELPVASSIIMEKLVPRFDQYSHNASHIYVRITLWTPYNGIYTIPISTCHIPELCELKELRYIYDTRVNRTGTWEQLCNYTPQEIDHTTDIR